VEATLCFKRAKGFKLDWLLEKVARETGANVLFVDAGSKELVAVIRGADVIHCQNATIDVALLAKLFRKPLAMTIHGWKNHGHGLRAAMRRMAWELADRRWYNSQFVWNTWEPSGPRKNSEKLPVISDLPTGVVPPEQRKGFVFIARWIANKGIDVLVEAYSRAEVDRSAWPLILLGDGPLRPAIEQKIREEGIEGIQIRGFVDQTARDNAIRHACWMVTPPNTREDLGLTPIEARHVGVPCIITRDGGVPEAGGRHALMCEPGDVDGLKLLLEKAARMPAGEYEKLAHDTREELLDELQPMSVYLERFREMVR
jgi:glycosyltransferase involved in cell wall biosynthesis